MWDLQDIHESGLSFAVNNGSAALARWIVDPALPWVLIEEHSPHHLAFAQMHLPLSSESLLTPRTVRASSLTFDLLYRTGEFLDALDELASASSGGIMMWQLDKEPKGRVSLSERMFDPAISPVAFRKIRREVGARLMLLSAHRNEVSQVSGVEAADVRAAWERVMVARAAP
jgi:hypothetical protein